MPSSDLCSSDLSRRRHTRLSCDWSSDVCSPDRSEEHTSELQSHDNLVCRLLTCALPIRSEEHTSELQSHDKLVCRLLREKKNARARQLAPSRPTICSLRALTPLHQRAVGRLPHLCPAHTLLPQATDVTSPTVVLTDAAPTRRSTFPLHAALPI